MNMKFDMGADTLSVLGKQTGSSAEDLGQLVRDLAKAAEPLQGRFNGSAKAVFDRFHANSGEISNNLNRALHSVLAGIGGQNTAFIQGEQEMADQTQAAMGSAFQADRFGGSKAV